jgi:hypothetical protein
MANTAVRRRATDRDDAGCAARRRIRRALFARAQHAPTT